MVIQVSPSNHRFVSSNVVLILDAAVRGVFERTNRIHEKPLPKTYFQLTSYRSSPVLLVYLNVISQCIGTNGPMIHRSFQLNIRNLGVPTAIVDIYSHVCVIPAFV